MVERLFHILLVLLLLPSVTPADTAWSEISSRSFSLFYPPGYEDDAHFVEKWLRRAEVLMREKYDVTPDDYRISFYLYAQPAEGADIGLARIECCDGGHGEPRTGVIRYLAPSVPAWRTTVHTSSLGLPFDQNFHAKVIMSEYIPVGHWAVQDKRGKGWNYYSAPEWFTQGLQEFDGIFHTTEFNRRVAVAKLLAKNKIVSSGVQCCSSGIVISDVYNGGALFLAFLTDQFGENIHLKLLRNPASSFFLALESETHQTIPQLHARFMHWLKHPRIGPGGKRAGRPPSQSSGAEPRPAVPPADSKGAVSR